MTYKIGIYQPNSDSPVILKFETKFPLTTNSHDNFIEMISYLVVNEVKYKAVKTTIFENTTKYEQVLTPELNFIGGDLRLEGWLTEGSLIDVEIVTQSDRTPKQIKVPILPLTNSDYIKIGKRLYQCWELIQSEHKIQVVIGDSYSEDR